MRSLLFLSTIFFIRFSLSEQNVHGRSFTPVHYLQQKAKMNNYKHLWESLFDVSHLKPMLKNDFGNWNLDELGTESLSNSISDQISVGNRIARRQGLLPPLQSFLLFRDFDTALIKTNTYRAQLIG